MKRKRIVDGRWSCRRCSPVAAVRCSNRRRSTTSRPASCRRWKFRRTSPSRPATIATRCRMSARRAPPPTRPTPAIAPARRAPTTAQDVLPQVEKMRIERAGTQRWLVVPGSPDKFWPAIKEFWQELGFIVNVELPEAGVMETDWAENRAKIPQDIHPRRARQGVRRRLFDARARQVPHPPGEGRASRVRPRSTSAIAACTRSTRTKARPRRAGSRARPIRNWKPRCCAA